MLMQDVRQTAMDCNACSRYAFFFVEIEVELVICCGMFYTRAVFYVMQTFVSLSVCPSCSSAICHFVSLSGSWPALKIGTVDRTSTMYVSFFFFFFFFFFLFFFFDTQDSVYQTVLQLVTLTTVRIKFDHSTKENVKLSGQRNQP